MQIVIDTRYCPCRTLKDECGIGGDECYEDDIYVWCPLIGNGGVKLPKGHGKLGDLDAIWNKLKELEEHYQAEFLKKSNAIHESAMNGRLYGFTKAKYIVQDAPTIIEADKEESGGEE